MALKQSNIQEALIQAGQNTKSSFRSFGARWSLREGVVVDHKPRNEVARDYLCIGPIRRILVPAVSMFGVGGSFELMTVRLMKYTMGTDGYAALKVDYTDNVNYEAWL